MPDTRPSKAAIPLLVVLFLLGRASLSAAPPEQLGKVNFPTTCSSAVEPTIEKGVALLHSFQYKESEQTFSEAATREPKCAMAHWGKAMALYHQLWDFPGKGTLNEGRKQIDEAKKVPSTSAREKGFIAAAAAFFQKKSKMSHADRTKAYSAASKSFMPEIPATAKLAPSMRFLWCRLPNKMWTPRPTCKRPSPFSIRCSGSFPITPALRIT